MQVQDYLPFFQNLFDHYIQLTLANPAYAACIAIAAWLLTTIFYSLRIGFLNRRNRSTAKALLESQNGLNAAQNDIQELNNELTEKNEHIDQVKADFERELQRANSTQARLNTLSNQITESIAALTSSSNLAEQFSPNADGVEIEDLWQRYNATSKLLAERLASERKSLSELQQAFNAETAKIADKDQQLLTMQVRIDAHSQQVGQLEAKIEDLNTQLTRQEETIRLRLEESAAQHQADLVRLNALAQQAQAVAQTVTQTQPVLQTAHEVVKAPEPQVIETPVIEQPAPEPVAAITIEPAPAIEPERVQVHIAPTQQSETEIITSKFIKPDPNLVPPKPKKQAPKEVEQTTDEGVAGKLKSFFTSAKKRIDNLDGKLGPQESPALREESIAAASELQIQATTLHTDPVATISTVAADINLQQAEPDFQPQTPEIPTENVTSPVSQSTPSRFKSLLTKFKK